MATSTAERGLSALGTYTTQVMTPGKWKCAADVATALQLATADVSENGNAWLLVHADFTVAIAHVNTHSVSASVDVCELLCPEYIQELRLFGLLGEWHVWRHGNVFRERLCSDTSPAQMNYIEEHQALWGTSCENGPLDGWSTLSEERGARYAVPHIGLQAHKDLPMRLRVRHYLQVDPQSHLTKISDSRLVALCDVRTTALRFSTGDEGVPNED